MSPYASAANNGNTRTAARWAELLRATHPVILRTTDDSPVSADILIALHARRSHAAILDWRAQTAQRPCILVLTGTDLYRDVPHGDADAMRSLELADRLIVLQERGIDALPARFRAKAHVVYQSARPLAPCAKSLRSLRALYVGHLRPEKDPFTFLRAAATLNARRDIRFAMIGGVRDEHMAAPFEALLARAPNVDALGPVPHARTRQHIRRAHVLVVPSVMEGGANVVVEAAVSATPVIASDCDGNIGMLGRRYPGYFPVGDPAALAALLMRCRDEPAFLDRLRRAVRARAPRFSPEAERRSLLAALRRCTSGARARPTAA